MKKHTTYKGEHLNRIAFPLGGLGAGCFCIEGTGALSHFQLRHNPDLHNAPNIFAALKVEGKKTARVLEGQVPKWKAFGLQSGEPGLGLSGKNFGLPRFVSAEFSSKFPFAFIKLADASVPFAVEIMAWSPFIPDDADNSSLPVAALEYTFTNKTKKTHSATFSFNAANFMRVDDAARIDAFKDGKSRGILLVQPRADDKPAAEGAFAFFTDEPKAEPDAHWFRGGWFDSLTMLWKKIDKGVSQDVFVRAGSRHASAGGGVFVPFTLRPGASKTIKILCAWFVPRGEIASYFQHGKHVVEGLHEPWYTSKFAGVAEVAKFWAENFKTMRAATGKFTKRFYGMAMPVEFTEAIANNLSILKSPTMLRQKDGRLWCWEGCGSTKGSCHGTCTHVWNYAQAVAHLFPSLERTLRETEFLMNQDERGHQNFRARLPVRPADHDFHAAADGQLGGIMKLHREWKKCGDDKWLRSLWPAARQSLNYCVGAWDPDRVGALVEPHHNTYDIEFWGANGMCQSFYCGALAAAMAMARALGDYEAVAEFAPLHEKSVAFMEKELWKKNRFIQKVRWRGLHAGDPAKVRTLGDRAYSPEARALLECEGPKYQYGDGCLSDGVLGDWLAYCCGVETGVDRKKIERHLLSVFKYNFRKSLKDHANAQRPGFAFGDEPGLLLCSWPDGGKPSLPFVYSDEVWTGVEYQVAAHLLSFGRTKEALAIVRAIRARYDGRHRNPFDEYECGHWYGRALASYGLIQAYFKRDKFSERNSANVPSSNASRNRCMKRM